MSSASSGGILCRRRNAKMGPQYVRQSFSSASCAAGDSPCASSTTLQCVVVKAMPPFCPLARVVVAEVTSWGAPLTVRSNKKIGSKASASNKSQKTDVTIENEMLKIDLHPEHADVTVRYRMHNTGPKVQQDFFFPVERWGKNPDADTDTKGSDIDHYQISVDGKELKWTNVAGAKEESSKKKEGT